ncbi:hypothetical protein [Streptomyces sp. NPDC058157]|uniref:hypothetical protein n=1 Tax=Streptomyces sp. NPDC058157 TaxID=3346360 RepID=UPI0036EA302C
MRTGPHDMWVRLRRWLPGQGIDPAESVLVHLFPCGTDMDHGVLLSGAGRVHAFELHGLRARRGAGRFVVRYWRDITEEWRTTPFAEEIAHAFIWRPPPRRTRLTE